MMIKYVICTLILLCMLSCVEEKENELIISNYEQKLRKHKAIIQEKENFIDLLNSELNQISTDLNSIQVYDESKIFESPLEKISFYDSLLIQSNNRVTELETLLRKASNSSDAKLLKTMVNDLNSRLIEKDRTEFCKHYTKSKASTL